MQGLLLHFQTTTTIKYSIEKTTAIRLEVYNVLGQRIALPVDEIQPAGVYKVMFDGTVLASGMYAARLTAGTRTAFITLMLTK